MKDENSANKYEPTLVDVLQSVQTGFGKMEERFDNVEERLTQHDKMLEVLVEGQDILNERVGNVERRLDKTQNRIEDIAEMLEDKYEPRLKHLEEVRV